MKFLQLYFSFTGRLSLKDFWIYWLIPMSLVNVLFTYFNIGDFYSSPKTWIAISLVATWSTLATSAKRLHDINISAWWLLFHLIPILGSVVLYFQILFISGTVEENRFDSAYRDRHPEEFQNKSYPLKTIVSLLVVFQVFCFFSNRSILSVIYTDGPYHGRVVDAETGEPIAGAVVAGVWEFGHIVPIQIIWGFADAQETVTDLEGNFKLSRQWTFTPWIMTTKLKLSELYVFKSGYDSHPPYIYKRWTKEDEERRKITKGNYQRKYKKRCEPKTECIVKLSPTQTYRERKAAFGGARIDGVPLKHKKRIRNYISTVNAEGKEIGAEEWPVE